MPAPTLADYASHSPYSDPGRHADLVAELGADPASLRTAACDAVVHYRSGATFTADQVADIDRRWLASILDAAVERTGALAGSRTAEQVVAGCCRDHTLLTVGTLREHKVPARSRVGFAGYFDPGFHADHVIVEYWDGERWRRFDPELGPDDPWGFDPADIPAGHGSPFVTAAEAWLAVRSGAADPATFGVTKDVPELCGRDVVRDYVLREVAHRHRDELLLWDMWGPMLGLAGVPATLSGAVLEEAERSGADLSSFPGVEITSAEYDAIADELAHLLVAADAGDDVAAQELGELYFADARLRPGDRVLTLSPSGRSGLTDLATRTTDWRSSPSVFG
ncbi:transglutaminase domain-containing protein [Antribacter gilvus]|uniref:transglutaminase domain-containing protein n=1 Tax=Antribacter gilvus TaxID=2304675 RepID=UPI0013E08D90|nr:transglutaminase domain-containing protein [Antribacter gilvus]